MIIVFFGTSHFAVPILNGLADSAFKPSLVVTQPDAVVGRKKILMQPPIAAAAKALDIEMIQPETMKTVETVQKLETLKPDLFILAAYGRIISENILSIPKSGSLNIHPSLLPKYRGPSPIHAAILNGDKETGSTIIQMDAEIDHGPIVAQKEMTLIGSESYETLQKSLSDLSINLLLEILPAYCSGKINPAAQNHAKAVFCKMIKSENARIDWAKSAIETERMIRAYRLWPKAHTFWKKASDKKTARLNIAQAKIEETKEAAIPGLVIPHKSSFAIAAGTGLVIPEIIQMEGRKEMDIDSFFRGNKDIIGANLL